MAVRLPVVKRVCHWSDQTLKREVRSMLRQNESGVAEIAERVGWGSQARSASQSLAMSDGRQRGMRASKQNQRRLHPRLSGGRSER
jgi:hypothetical protein